MMALPAELINRLAKVAGMLGSDHDGERAAAALQATRIIREAGWTWRDVIEAAGSRHEAPIQFDRAPTWREQVDDCLVMHWRFTAWEMQFLRSLARSSPPTKPEAAGDPRSPHNKGHDVMLDITMQAIDELSALGARFVDWRWQTRDGKRTKPPFNPHTGGYADVTDPSTWADLGTAMEASERDHMDGIGFVLDAARDGIIGIDLDSCPDPNTGKLAAWASPDRAAASPATPRSAPRQRREDPAARRPGTGAEGQQAHDRQDQRRQAAGGRDLSHRPLLLPHRQDPRQRARRDRRRDRGAGEARRLGRQGAKRRIAGATRSLRRSPGRRRQAPGCLEDRHQARPWWRHHAQRRSSSPWRATCAATSTTPTSRPSSGPTPTARSAAAS